MKFFFVITQKMVDKYGMPEQIEAGTYAWKLGYSTSWLHNIHLTAGDILNVIKQYGKKDEVYAICRAQLKNETELLRAICHSISGGELGGALNVIVDEITWVSNNKIKMELAQ